MGHCFSAMAPFTELPLVGLPLVSYLGLPHRRQELAIGLRAPFITSPASMATGAYLIVCLSRKTARYMGPPKAAVSMVTASCFNWCLRLSRAEVGLKPCFTASRVRLSTVATERNPSVW